MEKVKVYSFGATRKRHNHITDKREEYIDWNDMHTVRLDHEPIEIPDQYTWCSWYMLDMLPPEGVQGSNILLYAISSSTINQSMMDASVNKTWDELLRGTRVSLSGLHLWGDKSMQYHHWGSLWANLKPIPPKLKQWRSICVGQDSPHGSVIVYNDGEIADQTVVGEYYSKAWEGNKNITYSPEKLSSVPPMIMGDFIFPQWFIFLSLFLFVTG